MAKEKNAAYISNKESRRISKENAKITKAFERQKKKRVPEAEYLSQMKNDNNVIEFDDLHTYFYTDTGVVKAVNGVSFDVPEGSIVGVVGESGCGKSVTSLSLMKLVQGPYGQIVSGSIRFKTKENKVYDIVKMPITDMSKVRGNEIAMIFQEPMTSLNPVFTIGYQLDESTLLHVPNATKEMAKEKSIEMLKLVGIAMPENVYKRYPHELSGGMRQRVMIAMALACNPRVIIADEPTTALDVTIQAQILRLLKDLKSKINGSILLITHDLGVIAEMADYVVVMYAGKIVEQGTVREIFKNPLHPYTMGLQKSKPVINQDQERLYVIPGQVPNPIDMPNHCYFKARCEKCISKCGGDFPSLVSVSETHKVACHLYDEVAKGEDENE